MKKDLKYYLENTSRLSEVSIEELDSWIEEMPYSQPLRLLMSMKREQEVNIDKNDQVYGAFFAQDYEHGSYSKAKVSTIVAESKIASTVPPSESLPVIEHAEADDSLEDIVLEEVEETTPNVVLVNEVSHPEADEVLEDLIVEEILENDVINDPGETDKIVIDQQPKFDADLTAEDAVESSLPQVDYTSYVDVPKELVETEPIIVESSPLDQKEIYNLIGKGKKEKPKKKKKSSSKKKDKLKALDKIVVSATPPIVLDEELVKDEAKVSKKKKKKKSDKKKIKAKENKKVKKSKKKSKKENSSKKRKTVKGEVVKEKSKKKVKYVLVDASDQQKDFEMKDYDGVSKYTSWLLDQESPKTKNVSKKKSGKKKKKKSKVLKIAKDSVKKSDIIISEPLAKILAEQGHKKKAKKMYKQLSLIFPEKSSYFASQIENLKK